MAQCCINGIQVLFPYKPYSVQEEYMKKVIECLQKGTNGILESPTGTGKTLSLLCSSLAWLESRKAQQQLAVIQHSNDKNVLGNLKSLLDGISGMWNEGSNFMLPKVIYSSRTHSQLSQAVQELKRSSYKHIKSVVLGSRDQLCLHADVSKAPNHTAKVYMCRAHIRSKTCRFHKNYEERIAALSDYQNSCVLDIEDLLALGRKHTVCPYFAVRNLKSKADIMFTPYNYIIDPKSRRAHGIELQGNVVIFDEAHNIESACEESSSFQLRSYDLALCITEVTQTMQMIKDFDKEFSSSESGAPDFTITDLSILKVMFCELEDELDKEVANCSSGDGSKPGDYMIDILAKVELTAQKKDLVLDLLDKIILYHSTNIGSFLNSKGAGLQKFHDLLSILFSRTSPEGFREVDFKKAFTTKYKVFLQKENINKSQSSANMWVPVSKKKESWKLDCWCFSPAIGMQDIVDRGVHSIILTSGTLSPLRPIINELGVNFPVQLENPHIIEDNQVFVAVVTCGPDGTPLNSSFQNRSNLTYVNSLGRSICNFARIVPDGMLIFFPSYSVMRSNVEHWEGSQVWQSISGQKPLFLEPQGKDAFQESIEKYYATINKPESKGAALMAVCRGKVSEGLDFADQNARGVVITGLPFPPFLDPRVKLKMNYLNTIAKESKESLQGNEWYTLQASRAVNQAIGRVIRHKNDYGAIIFCDNRFKDKRIQLQLSKWIRGRIHVFDSFGPALKHLSSFFKGIEKNPKHSKPNSTNFGAFQSTSSLTIPANLTNNTQLTTPSKKNSDCDSVNVFESYRKDSTSEKSAENSRSSSVFDLIEEQSHKCSSSTSNSPLENYKYSGFVNSSSVPSGSGKPSEPKKRKLNMALRDAHEPKENSTEMWKTFLNEVKATLGISEEYKRFCLSIKHFKTSKNTKAFAASLKIVFLNIPDKSKFLQTASLLVPSQDRETFWKFIL